MSLSKTKHDLNEEKNSASTSASAIIHFIVKIMSILPEDVFKMCFEEEDEEEEKYTHTHTKIKRDVET